MLALVAIIGKGCYISMDMDYYMNLKHLCYIMAAFGCHCFHYGPLSHGHKCVQITSYFWCGFVILYNLWANVSTIFGIVVSFHAAPTWMKMSLFTTLCNLSYNFLNSSYGIFISLRKRKLALCLLLNSLLFKPLKQVVSSVSI